MNKFNLKFHHFGLAVKNPEKAIKFLQNMNYKFKKEIYDELQKVNLILCLHNDMPAVELIYAHNNHKEILDNILKYKNESIYHLCYETKSIDDSLVNIKNSGFRVITISKPQRAVLFDNNKVGFYYVGGFGLIEILERNEK